MTASTLRTRTVMSNGRRRCPGSARQRHTQRDRVPLVAETPPPRPRSCPSRRNPRSRPPSSESQTWSNAPARRSQNHLRTDGRQLIVVESVLLSLGHRLGELLAVRRQARQVLPDPLHRRGDTTAYRPCLDLIHRNSFAGLCAGGPDATATLTLCRYTVPIPSPSDAGSRSSDGADRDRRTRQSDARAARHDTTAT